MVIEITIPLVSWAYYFEKIVVKMTEQPFQPPNASTNGHSSEAQRALEREAQLPLTGWQQEVNRGLKYGLEAAESIRDRSIPNFSRGELPHYAGINTFLTLGLEFTVASDILRTAVAPTRQDILNLGAIVLLRTLLNYFLEREIQEGYKNPSIRQSTLSNE